MPQDDEIRKDSIDEVRKQYYSFMFNLQSEQMLEEFRQITNDVLVVCYRRLDNLSNEINLIHDEQEQLQAFVAAIEEGQ